jgi:Zn-dependent metalloprotease
MRSVRSFHFIAFAGIGATLAGCAGEERDASMTQREAASEARAVEVTTEYLAQRGRALPTLATPVTLSVRAVAVDRLDQAHVRLGQFYRGVPVHGGEAIAHVDVARGAVSSITDGLVAVRGEPDVLPSVAENDAALIGREDSSAPLDASTEAELVVLGREDGARLAYRVHVTGESDAGPLDRMVFVDAKNGEVLSSYDNLHTAGGKPSPTGTGQSAQGTARTLYSGNVALATELMTNGTFGAADPTRGGLYATNMSGKQAGSGALYTDADNAWGDGSSSDTATAGAEALYGAAMTWDYYAMRFDRRGIANNGVGALSRVHYGKKYNNAFWSDACKCMTYGDGDGFWLGPLVSLDIAAHEMTHGVTSATAGLFYEGESGGLNESMSDIFGAMVEFYASETDPTTTKVANWWIGEDAFTPGKGGDALRYMDDPRRDGASIDHYSAYDDRLDVHYSSGLPNNAFYLLAEGGTHRTSKVAVAGIGRDKAAAIFYRALVAYMTPTTNFAAARKATLDAAADLYGSSGAEVAAVASAWSACGVE